MMTWKYAPAVVGLLACAGLAGGCGGGGEETVDSGSQVLITRGVRENKDIYILSPTGEVLQQLTSDDHIDEAPRWSPDGTRIAFMRSTYQWNLFHTQAIHVMNTDGSNLQNLTPGIHDDPDIPYQPTWVNSDTLVYRLGWVIPSGLAKHTISTGEVTALTFPTAAGSYWDEFPMVSPSGTKLAYIHSRLGGDMYDSELYLSNADGLGARAVVQYVASDAPAWSPDGKKLAFVYARDISKEIYTADDTTKEIYVANADGSNPQRLTNNTSADFAPVWSPDSKELIFASNRDGNEEIYRMNADGSNQVRLTNNTVSDIPYGWR